MSTSAERMRKHRIRKTLDQQARDAGFEPYPVIAYRHPEQGIMLFRTDGRQIGSDNMTDVTK